MSESRKSREVAGTLLLVSGVTHVSQLAVYEFERFVVVAALFGIAYFMIGLLLFRPYRAALWLGAVLPAVGGLGGIYRFANIHPNPFTVFHVAVDLVVVPICIYWLVRQASPRGAA